MLLVGRQYRRRRVENEVREESVIGPPRRHQRVIVPASDVTRDVVQAIRFGRTMSDDVTAVHVTDDVEAGERIRAAVRAPAPGRARSIIVESPYRSLVRPLVRFLEDAAERRRRRRRGRAAARIRRAPLVGALPLQRERPADRTRRCSVGRTSSSPRSRSGASSRAGAAPSRGAPLIRRARSVARRG